MAVVSAWVASITDWLDQYGAIAWLFAGLLGGLLTALVACALAWLRGKWITGNAVRRWSQEVDSVNPLDKEFNKKRISLSDIAHPILRTIDGKKFVDCQLMGPTHIYFDDANSLVSLTFHNCDLVVLKPGRKWIFNVIRINATEFYGGEIWNCIIFVPRSDVARFRSLGAEFLTLTGDQTIDSLPSQDAGQKPAP